MPSTTTDLVIISFTTMCNAVMPTGNGKPPFLQPLRNHLLNSVKDTLIAYLQGSSVTRGAVSGSDSPGTRTDSDQRAFYTSSLHQPVEATRGT